MGNDRAEELFEKYRVGLGGLGGHCPGFHPCHHQRHRHHHEQIVEKNPSKFRIDSTELAVRRSFIQTTREEVAISLMITGFSLGEFLHLVPQVKQMKEAISKPAQGERLAVRKFPTFASIFCQHNFFLPFSLSHSANALNSPRWISSI